MLVTEFEIAIEVRLVHPKNACLPMAVTPSMKVTYNDGTTKYF